MSTEMLITLVSAEDSIVYTKVVRVEFDNLEGAQMVLSELEVAARAERGKHAFAITNFEVLNA